MSAINFVVRDIAGNIQRGTVAGEGAAPSLIVGSGADVSLNLTRGQIASFTRQGQALEITLIDGRVILIEGYFTSEGVSENQLFLSADGYLTEVQLNQGAGEDYFANYVEGDGMGKLTVNEDLYHMRSADVMLADSYDGDGDQVGMLGVALGGLAPIFGWGGAAAAGAAVVGGSLLGGGGGGGSTGPEAPEVEVTSGTEGSDHIVNEGDHSDGVEIGGVGTPGSDVTVTVDDVTETTEVNEDGEWSVTFDPEQIETGEYETPVEVVITNEGGSTTVTDTLIVDTIIGATFDAPGGDDAVVNYSEHANGVTLSGTVTGGDSVVVTIREVDYEAEIENGSWSLDLPAGVLEQGEYDVGVTVTTTDLAGNSFSTEGMIVVDTVTNVSVSTQGVGGQDGIISSVNGEHSNGVTLTGTAEIGATVVVKLGDAEHTVTSTDGTWTTFFSASEVPDGETTLPVHVISTDLAMNVNEDFGSVEVDTFVNTLTMTGNSAGGQDGVINFDESSEAITMSGMVEVGSEVSVNLHGVIMQADVNPVTGAWTVTYPGGTLPGGDYDTTVVVTATDMAGNMSSLTENVFVDTVVGDLALSSQPIEFNDVVNYDEASNGVIINGTATPGLVVTVGFGTATMDVMAQPDGTWSANFPASMVPADAASVPITASISDLAGNFKEVSDSVMIDTIVSPFNFSDGAIAGNNIMNAEESLNGVTFTGQVEPFSSVLVEFGGSSQTVSAGSNGQWSATFPQSAILIDEYTATVTATATDQHDNTSEPIVKTFEVDTLVTHLTSNDPIAVDNIANASEVAEGVSLGGTVEVGSEVYVTFESPNGTIYSQADVDINGNWTLNYLPGEIPEGDYQANITIKAIDKNGNEHEITDTFAVDTIVTEAPVIENVTLSPSGYIATTIGTPENDVTINEITSSHQTNELAEHDADASVSDGIALSSESMYFGFDAPLPNGSHLVVNETDTAGNTNGTFVVLEETTTNAVDLEGLSGFNIGAIDLGYAQDAELTLDLATLEGLSDTDNNLIIHGSDRDTDQVTILGAQDTNQVKQIDGKFYDVYTMGDDAQIFIEEGIEVFY